MTQHKNGREALELMASAFVLCLGFGFCLALIVWFENDSNRPLSVLIGVAATITSVALLSSRKSHAGSQSLGLWFRARKPHQPAFEYQPRRMCRRFGSSGKNQPPTVESLREMRETSANTWVPSKAGKRRGHCASP